MKIVTFDARDNEELHGLSEGDEVCLEVEGKITENDKGKLSMEVQEVRLSDKQYEDEDEEEESDEEEDDHKSGKPTHKALVIMMRR